ncbi:ribosomal RNA small subunit methyltransferase B [Burkholderia mallei]|nr:ribosomal RNA small subunit methyltransferase B [Burkholderia mallei]
MRGVERRLRGFGASGLRGFDASTLRRFDASTLRRFDASTLRRFDASTLRRFDASTLRRFDASTLRRFDASTLRRFDASTLRRFDASTLRRFDASTAFERLAGRRSRAQPGSPSRRASTFSFGPIRLRNTSSPIDDAGPLQLRISQRPSRGSRNGTAAAFTSPCQSPNE